MDGGDGCVLSELEYPGGEKATTTTLIEEVTSYISNQNYPQIWILILFSWMEEGESVGRNLTTLFLRTCCVRTIQHFFQCAPAESVSIVGETRLYALSLAYVRTMAVCVVEMESGGREGKMCGIIELMREKKGKCEKRAGCELGAELYTQTPFHLIPHTFV